MPDDLGLKSYALRFIQGKYQGGTFPLRSNREIVVGRSSDLDMVLVEDMVSRKHAKILVEKDQILIQDLGSTNGTFVNGEKIKKARLREGDRILIGTSILKLVVDDSLSKTGERHMDDAEVRSMMQQVAARKPRNPSPMSGRIEEVPIPDLLQLFSTSKKSGVLWVRSPEHEGKIYMRNGRIYFCQIQGVNAMNPHKAVTRMVGWDNGFFELLAPSDEKFESEIDDSTEALLMDAMREKDELQRIQEELPPSSAQLQLVHPMTAKLTELSPEQLEVFQLVHNFGFVQDVLDQSPASDLETHQIILKLLQQHYITE